MQRFPNLAPAPPRHSTPVPQEEQPPQRPRPPRVGSSRKASTKNACVPCRKTKTKCDGKQPCARCQSSSNACEYDAKILSGERLNRLTHAYNEQKAKLMEKETRLSQLETMLAAMREGTDAEAAEIMSWVRIGESVEAIVSYIESKSNAVVVHSRTEWLDGTIFEAKATSVDLGSRTQSYFSYHFGNLPFSSGIKANHYPAVAQQGQLQNYYAKHNWSMMTANDGHGVDSVTKAWADTLKKARQLVTEGANPDDLTGTFPSVAALFDKDDARRQDYAFTSMAAVWLVWVVMRWQINPTPESYADMPDWIRPTELQVFVPHIDMVDLLAACTSGVQAHWDGTIEEAICVDGPTGRKRLTPEAEAAVRDIRNWSLAASYRAFMPGIDGNIPIRTVKDAGVS
ncbi:unnamed protein product [Fusarium equiseti]|uniref:Zn(2)-C6 fungal-type domain-containing protein n=1 Tax=Fusarium equiseti TaxID=61235 RepID=A0A8J2JBR1_FUSEQ|nr:unnamed protein product [Fusarium equiseti]